MGFLETRGMCGYTIRCCDKEFYNNNNKNNDNNDYYYEVEVKNISQKIYTR